MLSPQRQASLRHGGSGRQPVFEGESAKVPAIPQGSSRPGFFKDHIVRRWFKSKRAAFLGHGDHKAGGTSGPERFAQPCQKTRPPYRFLTVAVLFDLT
jgi:hypothetical protein